MRLSGNLISLALILLISVAIWIVVTGLKITTDLGVFLPPPKDISERLLVRQLGKGATSQLVFIGLRGADQKKLAEANKALAKALRRSDLFADIHNGEGRVSKASLNFVFENRYLLSSADLTQRFSVDGLRNSLNARLRDLTSPLASLEKRFLRNDPTGEIKSLFKVWGDRGLHTSGPNRVRGVWFAKDKQRSLLVAELKNTAFDLDAQGKAIHEIQDRFDRLGPSDVEIVLSGPAAFAVESRDQIRADVRFLSIVSTVLVVLFLFVTFRSVTFIILVMLPLVLGVLVAMASVLIAFDSIHGITLAFGVTLTGVAVDYPIHLFSQLGSGRAHAREQVKRIWPTLRLGVLTTIVAYASLMFSGFRGLIQLGLFTLAGLLTAAAVTRWLLPLVMPGKIKIRTGAGMVHTSLERLGRLAPKARTWATLLVVLAGAYLILTETPLRDDRPQSLSPIEEDRRAEDRMLRDDLDMWSGGKMLAVIGDSSDTVLSQSERLQVKLDLLQKEGAISGYTMAAQFLPSDATQRERQSALPESKELRVRFAKASKGLPFRPKLFEPFFEDVEQARKQAPVSADQLSGTTFGARLSSLLFRLDQHWVAVVLLHDVRDTFRPAELSSQTGSQQTLFLDLKAKSMLMMENAMNRVVRLVGWGGLIIYLILALAFQSAIVPLRILAPTLASVLTVSALLVLFGTQLTIFHLVSLLLVIGLGLDYALFFHRLSKSESEWSTTFRALWVSCVTTVLVFGMLMFSHTPPLHAIGSTVAIGAALCLVFGAIWTSAKRGTKRRRPWKRRPHPAT